MVNKAIIVGNLGRDPEVRFTSGGRAVAKFPVATTEKWTDQQGQRQEKTEWHNIVAWRKLAEICGEWLKKGRRVYIEGRIQTRSYDDKNTGQKRYITEIVADDMIMLDGGGGRGASEGAGATPAAAAEPPAPVTPEDDLPF